MVPVGGTDKSIPPFGARAQKLLGNIAVEGIGTIAAIIMIAFADFLLERLIGSDKKFFSVIPIQWVFDAAHIAVVARLVWGVIKSFKELP